jgi:hypothetical protein
VDPTRYEIRLQGRAERTVRAAFDDLEVHADDGSTRFVGELDQAGLHSVLERVQRLGLVLLEVRVVRDGDPPS